MRRFETKSNLVPDYDADGNKVGEYWLSQASASEYRKKLYVAFEKAQSEYI